MDESQVIDDAVKALKQIRIEFRGENISRLAGDLSELIQPTMAFDSSLKEAERRRLPVEFAKESGKIIARKPKAPAYKTPVFKCLSDYEQCISSSTRSDVCIALMVVCVSKHLIPFVRQK